MSRGDNRDGLQLKRPRLKRIIQVLIKPVGRHKIGHGTKQKQQNNNDYQIPDGQTRSDTLKKLHTVLRR